MHFEGTNISKGSCSSSHEDPVENGENDLPDLAVMSDDTEDTDPESRTWREKPNNY